jgi:cation transport regulator ChaC
MTSIGDDDPYIVFGYGSLIFRVRFTTTGLRTADKTNETFHFPLMDARTHAV